MIVSSKKLDESEAAALLEIQKGFSDGQREMAINSPHMVFVVARRKTISPAIRNDVYAKTDGKCAYCEGEATCIDHVYPHSRGGSDEQSNLVGACSDCNSNKSDQTPEEWLG